MTIPPKLGVDSEGRVHGANVTWNKTFPCVNGNPGQMVVPAGILGFVLHTQVGNNPGTVETFNTPHLAKPRSAHFCVAQDGSIVQMGPINGWKAWAQVDGNRHYYSAEFADDKKSPPPALSQEQVNSGAQLLELLSRDTVGRFPMQLSDRPGDEGFGWHGMGGKSWGDHPDCPGDARKAQRADIIE
ncbi:MAG TPA: N-acetylmuramoyl-L-alanine amidase, partial [Streptosporangiaceae bacterium]